MKFLIIILGVFISHTALSESLSEQDRKFFVEETSLGYGREISKIKNNKDLQAKKGLDPNDVLYASLKYNKNTDDAIQQFAKYFNLDDRIGKIAAQELITAYKIQENCSSKRKPDVCPPTEFNPQNIKTLNDSNEADAILFEIASTIDYRDEISQFILLVRDNQSLLLKLFDYSKDVKYLAPLVKGSDTPDSILINAALKPRDGDTHPIDQIALDDFILKKNGENYFDKKLEIQNDLISKYLSTDLNAQAINLVNEISKGNIEAYLRSKENIFNCNKCTDISNELIAYQIESGNFKDASKLASLFKLKKLKENRSKIEIREFLLNLMSPEIDRKGLYNLMIHGDLKGKKKKNKNYDDYEHVGWLTSLSEASPIIRKLAYKYFEKMNYPEFARYMKENHRYRYARDEFPLAKGLGADYQAIVNRYEALIKANNSDWVSKEVAKPKNEDYKTLIKITEKDLTAIYQNRNAVEPEFKLLPSPLPFSEESIIRSEKFNDEWYVIYLSSALDPTGEVPAPGYWIAKTTRHGIAWEKPAYMGMQMYFPYEITPNAPMPMMSDGGLDLQADIKELDIESITFPPVGLFFKREKSNLVIHISLDDLFKDSDQDGLTDILETKIGSSANDPDTDKDGFVDGSDTLPLTPFNKSSVVYNQIALLLLKKVVGIDERAITVGVATSSDDILTAAGLRNSKAGPFIDSQKTLFLTGKRELFAGLDIPFRLVFVDEELPVNTGYSLPTDLGWLFPNADLTEFYVIWNSGWAGGSFIIRIENGKMQIEEVSSWIT